MMKKREDQKSDLIDFSIFDGGTPELCDYFIINTFENQFLFTSLKPKEVENVGATGADNDKNKHLIIIKR